MSMSDPVGDMLTRIRNAGAMGHRKVECIASRLNAAVLDVLRDEGYIRGYQVGGDRRTITVALKYFGGKPVIERVRRVSRPGLRRYAGAGAIKPVMNGLGIAVVSTSRGVMADHQARADNVGGEIICHVS